MAKRKGTTKDSKSKKSKEKNSEKTYIINNINLDDYIILTPSFKEALEKEFENSCTIPVQTFICTCKPPEENVKTFFLSYPKPEDYEKKKLTVTIDAKMTNKDIQRLKKVFKSSKK